MRRLLNRTLIDNLIWFAGSLVFAFFVWVIATFQSDPIQQQRYPQLIEVHLVPDSGLLMTSPSVGSRVVSVVIRAPRSVLDLLTREEINISAELSGLGPGEHTVELQAKLARQQAVVVDMSPRQMRVTLEEAAQRQIPLRSLVVGEPPAGFSRDEPVFNVNLNQVLVSGAASKVDEVVAAQVELDLRQERNPLESDLRLIPVDAEGNPVSDVTLDPPIVGVQVNIRRRDDVREVSIRPNILGTPPKGYLMEAVSYEPQSVLVSGLPAQLVVLPETLTTEPIDLNERITSFEVTVPVVLPADLLLLSSQTVTISVEINPVISSRQFDVIPVEVLGLAEGLSGRLAPNQVSVLITGPQAQLDSLQNEDIRVVLDLNGLEAGNYTLAPSVAVGQGQIPDLSISILPADIDLEIVRSDAPLTSGR